MPRLKALDVSGNQITSTGHGYFAKALESQKVENIVITFVKQSISAGKNIIKAGLKEFVSYAKTQGVDTTHIVVNKDTLDYLKDARIVGEKIGWGYGKCYYKLLEVIAFDFTAPSLATNYLIEKSGKEVLKKGNIAVCFAIETHDGLVTPEGVDLAVKAIDLLRE